MPPGSADLSPISGTLMIIARNYHQSQKMKYIKVADFPAMQSLIEVMMTKAFKRCRHVRQLMWRTFFCG